MDLSTPARRSEHAYRYRFLERDEFQLLAPMFAQEGLLPPNPMLSMVAAAFDEDDKVIGYIVLQLVPHAEPIWVHPEHRGTEVWEELGVMIDTWCKLGGVSGFYVQPTSPMVVHMAEKFGCVRCENPLYLKAYYDPRETYAEIARQLGNNGVIG